MILSEGMAVTKKNMVVAAKGMSEGVHGTSHVLGGEEEREEERR